MPFKWSKKLTAFIAVMAVLLFGPSLGMTAGQKAEIINIAMAYLGGQSLVDVVLAWKGKK